MILFHGTIEMSIANSEVSKRIVKRNAPWNGMLEINLVVVKQGCNIDEFTGINTPASLFEP